MALTLLVVAASPPVRAQDPIGGSFDTTPFPGFAAGNGKITNLSIGTSADAAQAVVIQPDGKIVLAGYCVNAGNADACVARLNADGTLDTAFDGPDGTGNGKFMFPIGTGDDAIMTIALQPDGKIVLAGYCANGGLFNFCAARLNPNGSLDPTFVGPAGTGAGKFIFPIGSSNDTLNAMQLQPDGKIVMVGHCTVSTSTHMCAARLNPDGSFDTSFDGPAGTGNGRFTLAVGAVFDYAYAVALQTDGKLVLAGSCWNGTGDDYCLVRLNGGDGTLDATFDGPAGNGNGKFLVSITVNDDSAFAMAIQPDGKIVLTGGSNSDTSVARLNPDGTFDTNFDGPAGNGDGKFTLPLSASSDSANWISLQGDGKIILGGSCLGASAYEFCVARLNNDGSFDPAYDGPAGNGNGKFVVPLATGQSLLRGMALQSDGKLVVAGYCTTSGNTDFCVARLNGGGAGARTCSLDIDGDGQFSATTDTLIATRIALGIRGAAVINGIAFPANAKRNTWPLLRDYLSAQCGLALF